MTRAVVYIRVSTEDQAESGLSLRAQEEAAGAFAERSGWSVDAVCRDEGVSAGKPLDKRPGLVEAIARLGRGDVLLVCKRDRIFRADPYECAIIDRAVASKGARIVSAAGEGTEDDSPGSMLMRRLLDAFAEYERLQARVRTLAVFRSKAAASERCGQVAYGTRLAADGVHLEPEPAEAGLAQLVRALREVGMSLRAIAAQLWAWGLKPKNGGAAWGASTIRRLLKEGPPCPRP